jgi:hypothetical protein
MTLEYPNGPIGREGINELGKICSQIVDVDGEINWQERNATRGTKHPQQTLLSQTLIQLKGKRRARATQLFHYLLVNDIAIQQPEVYEKEFNQCITAIRSWLRKQAAH